MNRKKTVLLIISIPILLLFIYGLASFVITVKRIERERKTLYKELNSISDTQRLILNNFRILNSDSREIREILLLPPVSYETEITQGTGFAKENDSSDINKDLTLYFKGIDYLLQKYLEEELVKGINDFFGDSGIIRLLNDQGLTVTRETEGWSIYRGDKKYYTIKINNKNTVTINTAAGAEKSLMLPSSAEKFEQYLKDNSKNITDFYRNEEAAIKKYSAIFTDPVFMALLKEKKLLLNSKEKENNAYGIYGDKGNIVSVTYNSFEDTFYLNNSSYNSFEFFKEELYRIISDYDPRPSDLIRIEELNKDIVSLSEDRAFLSILGRHDLIITTEPREDLDYYYYDITTKDGVKIGSYAVQKYHGILYLMDRDDVPLLSLRSLTLPSSSGEAKKKIDLPYEAELTSLNPIKTGTETILLCGAHENDTDTIILAHCDPDSNKITLISIPRDLFFKGRRINVLYKRFGPERLMNEIGDITGLNIEKYVVIDMYAFIDVINIIGGVTVTLQEDLIDPTYRIKEDGQWGTLFYPKGTHHLNGVAALRLARSRNYSSDFERAHRQQQILISAKDKITGLGFRDVSKLYQLVGALSKYVDTNMSAIEIVRTLLSYKDAQISGNNVIDTSNILYHTFSNLLNATEEEIQKIEEEDLDRGAWILIPVDNNWNLIPWYIRRLLE